MGELLLPLNNKCVTCWWSYSVQWCAFAKRFIFYTVYQI